jgi:hypothetical protein
MSKSTECISKGIDTSTKNPILFVPALAPMVIQLLFLILAYEVFSYHGLAWDAFGLHTVKYPNPWISLAGSFIASIVGFITSCMIVDMANDVINGRPMDLKKSMNIVIGRLGTLILAAIISAVCYITFILIPVALFIIAIAIIEGTDAVESTKRAFDFVVKNLGEVIVFIIIVIVINIVLGIGIGLIPVVGVYIGNAASWIINVIFTVASVHFYFAFRHVSPPPPPPPPPPPS